MPRIVFLILMIYTNISFADEWKSVVNGKLDILSTQLNDGWSEEEKDSRKVVPIKNGEQQLYVALLYVSGQHGGNGDVQYLVAYELSDTRPENEDDKNLKPSYRLVGLAIIGGRGERFVDFESMKFENGVFTFNAMAYDNDAMCCPSKPVTSKYKLTFYGFREL